VYEAGDPAAPTLLAVHGYPDNHTVWDGVTQLLAENFHVVRYDVRGAGDSDKPRARSSYELAHLVDDLASVLDAVSPQRPVHLLGHDWGSIQCWAALTDPRLAGRIASFTSISGPSLDHAAVWLRAIRQHPGATLRQLFDSYYIGLFHLPGAAEFGWRHGLTDRALAAAGRIGRSARARDIEPNRSLDDKINGLQLYRANMRPRLARPQPQRVAVPVQVLAPSRDIYVSRALQFGAPEPYVSDLRTQVVAGGHWVVSDRPDVIAAAVRRFIEQIEQIGEGEHARGDRQEDRQEDRQGSALGAARRGRSGRFGGQLVVVTGAARGIGRATAIEFARAGADLIVADIDDGGAEQTCRAVRACGADAWPYHLDVSDVRAWEAFAGRVRAEHGVPDVLVNNAGIGVAGPFLQTSAEDWGRILGVNLWSVIHGCRLFGNQMVERGHGGHIVNVASAAAYSPSKMLPAYSTTKAAVLMLSECLRAELAREGIGVTAVCPGFIDTDITRTTQHVGVDAQTQAQRRARSAAAYHRRNYPPERVASQIVRAAGRNKPVAAITPESKAFRLIHRFAPPLSRALARLDPSSI
jgi:NAD(P)-dependent dehydrogenase (short-subunit alcohol dehydrogenase family)/pimeloyl-ACP methyl ester carboxylesterase